MNAKEVIALLRQEAGNLRKRRSEYQKANEGTGWFNNERSYENINLYGSLKDALDWLDCRYPDCSRNIKARLSELDVADETTLPPFDAPPTADLCFRFRLPFFEQMNRTADVFDAYAEYLQEQTEKPGQSGPAQKKADVPPVHGVCGVCGWIHSHDFTRWENPHTGKVDTIQAGRKGEKTKALILLEGLHKGMESGAPDVQTAAAMGDKKCKSPRMADLLGDKADVLFMKTTRGRGKIRPPDPGKTKKKRLKR